MADMNTLACELVTRVLRYLSPLDALSFSSTCKGLRAVAAPWAFRSISFSSRTAPADSAYQAVKTYGAYVHELTFLAYLEPDPRDHNRWVPAQDDSQEVMPASAETLLMMPADLLPNLQSLTVKFVIGSGRGNNNNSPTPTPSAWCRPVGDPDTTHDYYVDQSARGAFLDIDESMAHMDFWTRRSAELYYAPRWRKLVASTWEALVPLSRWSLSKPLRKLVIDTMPPVAVSTWLTNNWRRFLARLEHLELSLLGVVDHSEHRQRGGPRAMDLFTSSLYGHFFQHLHSLETLKLEASVHGMLGSHSPGGSVFHSIRSFQCPLPFPPGSMPRLRSLELVHVFVDQVLVDFLTTRGPLYGCAAITSVSLQAAAAGCGFAGRRWPPPCLGTVSWAALFDALVLSGAASKISRFSFSPIWLTPRYGHWGVGKAQDSCCGLLGSARPYPVAVTRYSAADQPFCDVQDVCEHFSDFDPFRDKAAYNQFMRFVEASSME